MSSGGGNFFGPAGQTIEDILGMGGNSPKASDEELAQYARATVVGGQVNGELAAQKAYENQLLAQAMGESNPLAPALAATNKRSLDQQVALAKSARGKSYADMARSAELGIAAAKRNQGQSGAVAQLQAQQLQQNALQDYYRSQQADELEGLGQAISAEGANNQRAYENQVRRDAQTGQLLQGVGSALATYNNQPRQTEVANTPVVAGSHYNADDGSNVHPSEEMRMMRSSDERDKTSKQPVRSFLDNLQAYSYKYKEPDRPMRGRGEHISVMAQDLEKSQLGRQMVKDTPEGKVVDYAKGYAFILAAQADLNKRLKKMEK